MLPAQMFACRHGTGNPLTAYDWTSVAAGQGVGIPRWLVLHCGNHEAVRCRCRDRIRNRRRADTRLRQRQRQRSETFSEHLHSCTRLCTRSLPPAVVPHDLDVCPIWTVYLGPTLGGIKVGSRAVPRTHRDHTTAPVLPDAVLIKHKMADVVGSWQHGAAQILPARSRCNMRPPRVRMPHAGDVLTASRVDRHYNSNSLVVTNASCRHGRQRACPFVIPTPTGDLAPSRAGLVYAIDQHIRRMLDDLLRALRGEWLKRGSGRTADTHRTA